MEKDIYNLDNIRNIAEKYLDGTSTLSEEKVLYKYFTTNNDVPSDLQYLKDIFNFNKIQLNRNTPDFNKMYDNLILDNDEVNSDLKVNKRKDKKLFSRTFYLWGSISTAAVLVIAILINFLVVNKKENNNVITLSDGSKIELVVDGEHITDPDLALEYIQQSMMDIQSGYNEAITPAKEYFDDFYNLYKSSNNNVTTTSNRVN